jgi:hypothetical protein
MRFSLGPDTPMPSTNGRDEIRSRIKTERCEKLVEKKGDGTHHESHSDRDGIQN